MWHATIEKFVDGQWVHCMNLRTSSPGIQQLYRWIASKNGCDLRITVDRAVVCSFTQQQHSTISIQTIITLIKHSRHRLSAQRYSDI
jgi:hypothetical protein